MNELLIEINDLDLTVEETITIVENYWLELAENTADPKQKKTFMQKAGDVGRRILSGIGGAARGGYDALKQGYQSAGKNDFRKALEILKSSDLLTPEVLNAIKKADRDKRGVAVRSPEQKQKDIKSARDIAKDPSKNPYATQSPGYKPPEKKKRQQKLNFGEWLLENSK